MRNDIFLKEMGNKIKAARNIKNITLRQLATLCDLDYGSICRIERGQFDSRILTLKNLADNLNIDMNNFI